ncbi:MAG: hypothetical protein LBJ12_03900 [Oscillospiraceae bacterium]|nr:hypothetical protein [Oscillospiraceae bacterium]
MMNKQAGTLTDLWEVYATESERQQRRIARMRTEFNKIPGGQYAAQGYILRSRLAIMYRQLEELREIERTLRNYYKFSGQILRESKRSA